MHFESAHELLQGGAMEAILVAVHVDLTKNLSPLFAKAGLKSIYAVGKAIDEVGNKTKTKVIRATAKQAGVKYGRVRGVVSSRQVMGRAGAGQYEIVARDATLSLKEFGASKGSRGITARPWGIMRRFPHAFFGPGGHVYERTSRLRFPIKMLWGPSIPKEMVKDQAEETFHRMVGELLGPAIEKWLLRQVIQ
jgi:hypothetical protein